MAAYNVNPIPQWGQDSPFALIPGALPAVTARRANATLLGNAQQVGMPDPFGDLSKIYPNLGKSNAATSALISSMINGELSPETQRAIQDAAAKYGVTSGMVGGGLTRNRTARDLGRSTQDLQQKGIEDYDKILRLISATQTVSPELQAQINTRNANATDDFAVRNQGAQNQFELANQGNDRAYDFQNVDIANTNAINAAAANPGRAANHALELFEQFLQKTQGGPPSGVGGGSSVIRPSGGSGINFDSDGRGFGGGGGWNPDAVFGSPLAASGTGGNPVVQNLQKNTGLNFGNGSFTNFSTGTDSGFGPNYTPTTLQNSNVLSPDFDFTAPEPFAVSGTRDPYQLFESIPQTSVPRTPNWWDDETAMWS